MSSVPIVHPITARRPAGRPRTGGRPQRPGLLLLRPRRRHAAPALALLLSAIAFIVLVAAIALLASVAPPPG